MHYTICSCQHARFSGAQHILHGRGHACNFTIIPSTDSETSSLSTLSEVNLQCLTKEEEFGYGETHYLPEKTARPMPIFLSEKGHFDSSYSSLSQDTSLRPGLSDLEHDYLIKRIASADDSDLMPTWKRTIYKCSPLLIALNFCAYWLYFGLRVYFTILAEQAKNTILWMAWCFILVELFVAMPMFLHRLWGLHITGKRKRSKLRLLGDNVPSVDVVITCCKEDDDLILDTAKAACSIDYPRDRYRVFICDDGKSETLRIRAEALARRPRFNNLYYRSRPKYPGVPHHFKAGNLNYALQQTAALPDGAASFFAALDADMIPEPHWLRSLLPHMLKDPKCSMACPPQLFYNVPEDDPLCQSLDSFVHVTEPIKDAMGVAWCTGSGYILRRQAITQIGGFPTGSLAEDVCCSSLLLGSGWNTAFVHEALQYGTVPDSLASHLKQRTRWTIGTIQTSLKLRFCLFGSLTKHMTLAQRICGFIYTFASLFTIFLVISMLTAPIVLVSGGNLVPYSNQAQLRWLMRSVFLTLILNRTVEIVAHLPSGYRTGQREVRALFWMAPFHAMSIIRTFLLPSWLGGKVAVFTSTGSHQDELNERYPSLRAPLWRRLKVTLWNCNCYLHYLYIMFILGAVGISTYWIIIDDIAYPGWQGKMEGILVHAGWPPLLWLACIVSCWEPIRYAIWPPDMPDREDLLVRNPITGVAYPSPEAKKQRNSWYTWMYEMQYSLLTLYTIAIFVWSWWI